jgi:hypothetical protein
MLTTKRYEVGCVRKDYVRKIYDYYTITTDESNSNSEAKKIDTRYIRESILIKDTTKEERIRIVQEGLSQCGGACDFCNGCDNLGGGSVDAFYEPYINGEKELRELNGEYRSNSGLVH